MRPLAVSLLFAATFLTLPVYATPIVLQVGSGDKYTTISAAVSAANVDTNANDTFLIEVAPGTYVNDFSIVKRPMIIEVNPADAGKTVLLHATKPPPNDKGIVTDNATLTVNGLTFEGAAIPASAGENGAGIRDQIIGTGVLTIENSKFLSDQDGVLANSDPNGSIVITNSEFIDDGVNAGNFNCPASGCDHAVYVGNIKSLSVSGSTFCDTQVGHDIKSRAATTTITKNKLYDGAPDPALGCSAGSTSYAIDLPYGGAATISGNTIVQGSATQNPTMISYGEGGLAYSGNSLLVSGNQFINSGVPNAIGIKDPPCVPVKLTNNTFQGVKTEVSPASCLAADASVDASVPEPASLLFFLPALGGLAWLVLRRRRGHVVFETIARPITTARAD